MIERSTGKDEAMTYKTWNSARNRPRLSKRAMLATLNETPFDPWMPTRNTLIWWDKDGVRHVKLHDTVILTKWPDGSIFIDTGGFNTRTTRARLNFCLRPERSVFTQNGVIHLRDRGLGEVRDTPFLRTCSVDRQSNVKPDLSPERLKRLRKHIDAYIMAFKKRGLPTAAESRSDPWVFVDVSAPTMLDWLRTRYVFRKMFGLAICWAERSDADVVGRLAHADRDGLSAYDLAQIRCFIRAKVGLAS
jgi:hypothetical protein